MDLRLITPASLFNAYSTSTAILSLARQSYDQFVPQLVRSYVASKLEQWLSKSPPLKDSFTLVIDETDEEDYHQSPNLLYQACQLYLSTKLRPMATRLSGVRTSSEENNVTYRFNQGETYVESLENVGIDVVWNFRCQNDKGEDVDHSGKKKFFELTFDLAYKNEILDNYIPSVLLKHYDRAMEMKKDIYLYTYEGYSSWNSVKFDHPFTFDSLALDPDLKQSIINDLDMFIRRKEFYNKVGKAWKRGYLLYGPPGTGKSSLVAAMANYLRFSIYDLQLGGVPSDAVLRKLMLATRNKSILVIEDIDCSIGSSRSSPIARDNSDVDEDSDSDDDDEDVNKIRKTLANKQTSKPNDDSKLSLSGLLNFIDGLWSSCGQERIIIFTTNHKDRLDPALLRPGRMDMHIHMSYLTMKGFRVLVNNYLGVSGDHPLFEEIEPLLETTDVTPAQIAEELIRNEDADVALSEVIELLKKKSKQCQNTIKKAGVKRRSESSKKSKGKKVGIKKVRRQ
ncbi:AAA-ATPase At3g50940-like [Silene latifolia]|uniref:AAA-ATPase At3g50940-like n=1 Tax=Silene latifolia TaxID=37657 RepID=UPI003D77EF12